MSDFIFQSIRMQKKDFYSWFKNKLIEAGWQNISSRPASDNDIFYSKGESGEDEIFFRAKEFYNTQTTTTFSSSNGYYLSFMPLNFYKPSNSGVSGVAHPPLSNSTFGVVRAAGATTNENLLMTVYYHINKDRAVVVIDWDEYTNEEAVYFMIGKPTNILAKTTDITKSVFSTSSSYGTSVMFPAIADSYEQTSGLRGDFLVTDLPRGKTPEGDFIMSEIAIVNPTDSIHSIVDGIYAIAGNTQANYDRAMTGQILIDDEMRKYRVVSVMKRLTSITNIPKSFLVFRIE